jgi:hypothetical protein
VWASEDAVPPGKSSCCSPPARFGVVEGLVVGNDIPCVHGDHNVHHVVHGMRRSSNDHADHRREGVGKQKEWREKSSLDTFLRDELDYSANLAFFSGKNNVSDNVLRIESERETRDANE